MWAYGVGVVVASSSSSTHPVGSKVVGQLSWSQYALVDASSMRPYNEQIGLQHLSSLGAPGLAAHVGLFHNVGLKKGEVLLVSGAAGATGTVVSPKSIRRGLETSRLTELFQSQVVQLAKAIGASRIIGIASKSKCQSVIDNGADACLDYSSPSFEEDLIKATDRKVDVFFDNVGGPVLDAALVCMARQGRISVCGAISGYQNIGGDKSQAYGLKNSTMILRSVLNVKGFIILPPYTPMEEIGKAANELGKFVLEGKVKTRSVVLRLHILLAQDLAGSRPLR